MRVCDQPGHAKCGRQSEAKRLSVYANKVHEDECFFFIKKNSRKGMCSHV